MKKLKILYSLILILTGISALSCKKDVNPFIQPIVSLEMDSITSSSVVLKGHDLHYGVGDLKDYKCGFYWTSSSKEPTSSDNNIPCKISAYEFKAKLVGLIPGQLYNVKAYVVNTYASSQSNTYSFVTLIYKK